MKLVSAAKLGALIASVTLALPVASYAQQDHGSHSGNAEHTGQNNEQQAGNMMNHGGGDMAGKGGGNGGGKGGGKGAMGGMEGMNGMGGMMERMQQMHDRMHADDSMTAGNVFNSIQLMVRQLREDPNTDWSKVNIAALQQHLVDMEMLSLFAVTTAEDIPGGARFSVAGQDRVLAAIQRMVPMHAEQMNTESTWQFAAQLTAEGAVLSWASWCWAITTNHTMQARLAPR